MRMALLCSAARHARSDSDCIYGLSANRISNAEQAETIFNPVGRTETDTCDVSQ